MIHEWKKFWIKKFDDDDDDDNDDGEQRKVSSKRMSID